MYAQTSDGAIKGYISNNYLIAILFLTPLFSEFVGSFEERLEKTYFACVKRGVDVVVNCRISIFICE